jgi:parallel beta-helix repeat protein
MGSESRRRRVRSIFLVTAAFVALGSFPSQSWATHVSCGDTITRDTALDSDLIDCPADGIVIGADGITLDLNGHTIDGVRWFGQQGVTNNGFQSVTIRNGTVKQFGSAVSLSGVAENVVTGLTVADNDDSGVAIVRSIGDNLIEGNVAFGNGPAGEGILASGAPNTHIVGNTVFDNDAGVIVVFSDNSTIENNTTFGNALNGVELQFDDNVLVRGNSLTNGAPSPLLFGGESLYASGITNSRIEGNSVIGANQCIYLTSSAGNRIEGNSVSGCRVTGIVIDDATDNLVGGNSTANNLGAGISVQRGSFDTIVENNHATRNHSYGIAIPAGVRHAVNTRIERNVTSRNAVDGIFVNSTATGTLIEGNAADANRDDGIQVDSASATLTRNRARRNSDLGIEAVPGVTDGGGNRARHNGNPLQCLNVTCN